MLLNRSRLPLAYIVDDNPMKYGYLTPGQYIPIRSPMVLSEEPADLAVVLLAWNFATKIIGKLRLTRPGRSDQVVHYVPTIKVRDIVESVI